MRTDRPSDQYPRLAGQYVEYLVLQLTLLAEDRRGGTAYQGIMRGIASRLTAGQIADVAAYFASVPPDSARDARSRGGDAARTR